jgi:glyoxylase-like metal-dependent hydrolase (beta-lactamase superfamily II)
MKILENVEALELSMSFGGNESVIHPVLLFDKPGEMTLIDAGLPGQVPAIKEHLRALGLKMSNIRRLILTHQDIDHIGGAAEIVQETGAEVLAHVDDVPYIQGELQLIKFDPNSIEAMLKNLPEDRREAARRVFSSPPRVRVDRALKDGDELPVHGGLRIIHTPGHTPGHISVYLRAHGVLISGDALRVEEGALVGPSPAATPDMESAMESVHKLESFSIDRVLCYHGGLSPEGAATRIREIAKGA